MRKEYKGTSRIPPFHSTLFPHFSRSARLLAPRLNVLSLAGNSITEIKNVAGLADLNTLDLSRNAAEVRLTKKNTGVKIDSIVKCWSFCRKRRALTQG